MLAYDNATRTGSGPTLKVERSMSKDREDVLSRQYLERQMVMVSEGAFIEAAEAESRKQAESNSGKSFDWMQVADAVSRLLVPNLTATLIDAGVWAFKAWSKARESGLPVLAISREQAAQLSFPPGHPREGVVYVGHPSIPRHYYTLADFHRVMFEQKVAEAVELLMSLGATTIRAEHITGWSQEFSTKLSLGIPSVDAKTSVEASGKKRRSAAMLFQATLRGGSIPRIPPNLVWFEHEPTWKTVANGRMQYGLEEFSLSITYMDDFGINLGVKASVTKAGLDVGGKFEGHESTIWKLTGKFRPDGAEPKKEPAPKADTIMKRQVERKKSPANRADQKNSTGT